MPEKETLRLHFSTLIRIVDYRLRPIAKIQLDG